MSDDGLDFVEVEPIEYQKRRKGNRNPRLIRYRDLSFSKNLTQSILNRIIEETRMKKKASAQQNPDRFIFYQYTGKPQIILDLLEMKIGITPGTLRVHGERHCQQQASLVMRLLKQHGYASFNRVSITVDPYRFGKSKKDREITYKAIENLVNKT